MLQANLADDKLIFMSTPFRVGAYSFTPRGIFRHVNTMFNLLIGVNFANMFGMPQNICIQFLFCINFICLFT